MIYIILLIFIILLIYVFLTYNNLVRSKNYVKEGFSTMDVYLTKRWDLIPNLVEVVKTYAKHENTTFENVFRFWMVRLINDSSRQCFSLPGGATNK